MKYAHRPMVTLQYFDLVHRPIVRHSCDIVEGPPEIETILNAFTYSNEERSLRNLYRLYWVF